MKVTLHPDCFAEVLEFTFEDIKEAAEWYRANPRISSAFICIEGADRFKSWSPRAVVEVVEDIHSIANSDTSNPLSVIPKEWVEKLCGEVPGLKKQPKA